jgi:hypothetical protein
MLTEGVAPVGSIVTTKGWEVVVEEPQLVETV